MTPPRIAGIQLVLSGAVLVLFTGCGIVTSTKAPQPIGTGPASGAVPVASQGLQLGFTWQPDRGNLFPILGVSGAAQYGGEVLPTDAQVATAAAAMSSSSSWALVLKKDSTLEEWELSTSATIRLASRVALDSSIVFSPSGSCAAVTSASTRTLTVISGLPAKPQASSVALPSGFVAGNVAISDNGTALVGVEAAGNSGVLVGVLSETHSYAAVGALNAWGSAGFLPGTETDAAVIADASNGQVAYVTNLSGTSPVLTTLSSGGLLQKPVGVGISPDGKWAFVADGDKAQVVRLSLAMGGPPPIAIACACNPRQMVPLTADGIYSITGNAAGKPDWLLDVRTSQPRTFFVPALAVAASSTTAATNTAQSDRTSR